VPKTFLGLFRPVTVVAPRTGKIIKNVFVRGENLLQNGVLHFVGYSQSSGIALES